MTVVCAKDGILASDSGAFSNDTVSASVKKIFRLKDGSLVGFAGKISQCRLVLEYLENGKKPASEEVDDIEGLLIKPNGEIHAVESTKASIKTYRLLGKYQAIGSGAEHALTAMEMGADALRACKIAAKHHVFIRGPFKSLRLNKKKPLKKNQKINAKGR